MKKRLSIDEIKPFFEKEGYQLLSTDYRNSRTMLNYVCPKGHCNIMRWNNFQQGNRCPDCAGNKGYNIEQIKSFYSEKGYQLLSTEYSGIHTKLQYICSNGHLGWMRWSNFQQGERCPACTNITRTLRRAKVQALYFEKVRQSFEEAGYSLLSTTYVNNSTKLDYRCSQGHTNAMTWSKFSNGHRCPDCWEHKNQNILGTILEQIYGKNEVRKQDNLGFLERQRVDYSVRSLKLAFEYDGAQHFRPVRFRGMNAETAKKRFELQQEWDTRKNSLCEVNGYVVIRFPYYRELTTEGARAKINDIKDK